MDLSSATLSIRIYHRAKKKQRTGKFAEAVEQTGMSEPEITGNGEG
jgi:hypothetical protein